MTDLETVLAQLRVYGASDSTHIVIDDRKLHAQITDVGLLPAPRRPETPPRRRSTPNPWIVRTAVGTAAFTVAVGFLALLLMVLGVIG